MMKTAPVSGNSLLQRIGKTRASRVE
jgi:hypothetical protein